MNAKNETGFDIGYYLYITVGAVIATLNIKRYKGNKLRVKELEQEIAHLKNIIIGHESVINAQASKIKEYEQRELKARTRH